MKICKQCGKPAESLNPVGCCAICEVQEVSNRQRTNTEPISISARAQLRHTLAEVFDHVADARTELVRGDVDEALEYLQLARGRIDLVEKTIRETCCEPEEKSE